jgi:TRAP-type transport system periplasmic protein
VGEAVVRRLAGVVVVGLLAAGCGSAASGEAGPTATPSAAEPRVLRMGSPFFDPEGRYNPAVTVFIERVAELSGGALSVEVVFDVDDVGDYWAYLPEGEQEVVRAVAAGDVDLGWAGTRVFDTLGAPAASALQAPFVIDSHELLRTVLDDRVADDVVGQLSGAGVRGLALLSGGLRRPIAVEAPLRGPADWAGKTVQHFRSEVQAATVRALGAESTDVVSSTRDDGMAAGTIDAHDQTLRTYVVREAASLAPFASDVVLWPDVLAIIADPALDLPDEQLAWLQQAADEASARSVDLMDVDDEQVVQACAQGAKIATVSPAERAALEEAVSPVLDDLRADPAAGPVLARLEELKAGLPTAPALTVPAGCAA